VTAWAHDGLVMHFDITPGSDCSLFILCLNYHDALCLCHTCPGGWSKALLARSLMLAMPALDASLSPMDLSVDHGTGCLKLMLAYMFIICQRAQLLLPHHMCPAEILLAVVSMHAQSNHQQPDICHHSSFHACLSIRTYTALSKKSR